MASLPAIDQSAKPTQLAPKSHTTRRFRRRFGPVLPELCRGRRPGRGDRYIRRVTTTDEDRDLADTCIEEWASLRATLDSLEPSQWELPSGLPGWTVRDVVSHVIGFERQWFLGEVPEVAPLDPRPDHVHNDVAADNERWVRLWADETPQAMLDRFDGMVQARKQQLFDIMMSNDGFDTVVQSFAGATTIRAALPIRVVDTTTHEIDIRRACGLPWAPDAAGVALLRTQMIGALPRVASKQAGLADGTVVALSLFGSFSVTATVLVDAGRGRSVLAGEHPPVAALTMHDETFILVTTGRIAAADGVEQGKIKLRGDEAIARQFALALKVISF